MVARWSEVGCGGAGWHKVGWGEIGWGKSKYTEKEVGVRWG